MIETISKELDSNFQEEEIEKVLLKLSNGKSPSWDGMTNVVLHKYVSIPKSHSLICSSKCWDFDFMPKSGRWA